MGEVDCTQLIQMGIKTWLSEAALDYYTATGLYDPKSIWGCVVTSSDNQIQPEGERGVVDFSGIPNGAVLHGVIIDEAGNRNVHVALFAREIDDNGNEICVIYDITGSRSDENNAEINQYKNARRLEIGKDDESHYDYYYEYGLLKTAVY